MPKLNNSNQQAKLEHLSTCIIQWNTTVNPLSHHDNIITN